MKFVLLTALISISASSFAQDVMIIKKNHNPRNELRYKANVEDCKLKTPAITPYWVMGEEDGHTEGLTNQEKGIYGARISYQKETEADFSIGAMDRMGAKLPDKNIHVRIEDCKPVGYLVVNGREIKLSEIYVQVKLISVDYMIIKGTAPDGTKVAIKIDI